MSSLAGKPASAAQLIDVTKLVAAYYAERPDPTVLAHRESFGTSGHRGSAFDVSSYAGHVLATTQAVCGQRSIIVIGMATTTSATATGALQGASSLSA